MQYAIMAFGKRNAKAVRVSKECASKIVETYQNKVKQGRLSDSEHKDWLSARKTLQQANLVEVEKARLLSRKYFLST
eukprot:c33995_g1_i1 orf=2-229(-)